MTRKLKSARFEGLKCDNCGNNRYIVDREYNELICTDCGLIKALNPKDTKEKVVFT